MMNRAAQIEVRREHGKVTVIAVGRTGRGVKYVKGRQVLTVPSITDKNFKHEMERAVHELLGSELVDVQYGLDVADSGG